MKERLPLPRDRLVRMSDRDAEQQELRRWLRSVVLKRAWFSLAVEVRVE
jgi:hypothetical protein